MNLFLALALVPVCWLALALAVRAWMRRPQKETPPDVKLDAELECWGKRLELIGRIQRMPKCNGRMMPEAERLMEQYEAMKGTK